MRREGGRQSSGDKPKTGGRGKTRHTAHHDLSSAPDKKRLLRAAEAKRVRGNSPVRRKSKPD